MDVTNPLHPRLLWDIAGSLFQVGSTPAYSPTIVLSDALGGCTNLPPTTPLPVDLTPKWLEGHAKYLLQPAVDTGRQDRKVYDYQDLGGARGLSMAEVRVGLEPQYLVYAATAMPPGQKGIEVFAMDVATGQRVWQ